MEERELTEAQAWELRHNSVQQESVILQEKLFNLREQLVAAQKELLRIKKEEQAAEQEQFLVRIGVEKNQNGSLIQRDGKWLLTIEGQNGTETE